MTSNTSTSQQVYRNWLRVLYLSTVTTMLWAIIVYIVGFTLPIGRNISLHSTFTMISGTLVIILFWFLVDGFGVLEHSTFMGTLHRAEGLHWVDVILGLAALVVLVLCWRLQILNVGLVITSSLALVTAVLGWVPMSSHYSQKTMEDEPTKQGTADAPVSQVTNTTVQDNQASLPPNAQAVDHTSTSEARAQEPVDTTVSN